jgi:hypothetical protein
MADRIPVFANDGWSSLQPDEDVTAEEDQAAEQAEVAALLDQHILRCFSSPAGRKVFEWLWASTILQPTFDPMLGADNGAALGFAREGQNTLVHTIKARMDRAKELK